MPKVTINNAKGLVNSKGSGTFIENSVTLKGNVEVTGLNQRFRAAGQATTTAGDTGAAQVYSIRKAASAAGMHVYQEEVSLTGSITADDNFVICELSKTLPANAKIVDCAIIATTLSDLATVTVNLALSATAGTAQGVVVASGTILVGAGGTEGSGALLAGVSAGTLGDAEYRVASQGEFIDVGAKTSVYVASDATSNTVGTATTGRCLVTIRYYGSAAPA